jgi:hypothetical protein
MQTNMKRKYGAKHENIIRALHPTLGPPNEFINPMIHSRAQKQILNIF